MDYYKILKINKDASYEDIKSAYKKLVKRYHPDVYKGDKIYAEYKLKEINEAYEILSNHDKRKVYDNSNYNYNLQQNEKTRNYSKRETTKYEPSNHNNESGFSNLLKKIINHELETENFIILIMVIIFFIILLGMFFSNSYMSAIVILAIVIFGYSMYKQNLSGAEKNNQYIIFNSFEYEKPDKYFRLFILKNEQCWITTTQRKINGDFREYKFNVLRDEYGRFLLEGTTPIEPIRKVELVYITNIVGFFEGLKNGNRYKISNGQVWKQVDDLEVNIQLRNPRAFIIHIDGIYYMAIDGINNLIKVDVI